MSRFLGIRFGKPFVDSVLKNPAAWVVLALAVWLTLTMWKSRPISFEADAWKLVVVSCKFDVRYRMAHDLISQIEQMNRPSYDDLQTLLGPSDPGRGSLGTELLVYRLGRGGAIEGYSWPPSIDTWHLGINFDDKQQLREIGIYPDSP